MILFDGYAFARQKELALQERVAQLRQQGKQIMIAAVLFTEDTGSQLYTRLKKEAAERVGIQYEVFSFSMTDEPSLVIDRLHALNQDDQVTGIIIQKPAKARWQEVRGQQNFTEWWQTLVSEIQVEKDVDGLHPHTLAAIQAGGWQQAGCVMPATAKAVVAILQCVVEEAPELQAVVTTGRYIVLGKSDILGKPLFYELQNQGKSVEMIGSQELAARVQSGQKLLDADVIISATGRPHLITGELIKENVVIIDVGEPKPDVEMSSVEQKAAFITPVPGGVGPVTVMSLLENALQLRSLH